MMLRFSFLPAFSLLLAALSLWTARAPDQANRLVAGNVVHVASHHSNPSSSKRIHLLQLMNAVLEESGGPVGLSVDPVNPNRTHLEHSDFLFDSKMNSSLEIEAIDPIEQKKINSN